VCIVCLPFSSKVSLIEIGTPNSNPFASGCPFLLFLSHSLASIIASSYFKCVMMPYSTPYNYVLFAKIFTKSSLVTLFFESSSFKAVTSPLRTYSTVTWSSNVFGITNALSFWSLCSLNFKAFLFHMIPLIHLNMLTAMPHRILTARIAAIK